MAKRVSTCPPALETSGVPLLQIVGVREKTRMNAVVIAASGL
ncbi:hypothetical protein C900_00424 [Fulvivirga imtechensis AK7]|uniref:Uncharacterized protein n=1 Tax=Fulvivirga imtechensis AK7 TaxID=1237149 RepID=L8JLY0_9BACT|nr:hypothetical protein C900_00424 [Fulvivirga imtechensis AK7]